MTTHPDWDWYSIRLRENETVRISTDSLNVDTIIYVDFTKSRNNQVVYDDNSGGGLGLNSELVYRAPHTGEYFIAVTEAVGNAVGGYYLSVAPARTGTETVIVPPSPQLVSSRFGTMAVLEDPWSYFSIQAPEPWLELQIDELAGEVFNLFDPESGQSGSYNRRRRTYFGTWRSILAGVCGPDRVVCIKTCGRVENITKDICADETRDYGCEIPIVSARAAVGPVHSYGR